MKKILILALAFACGFTMLAQEAAAPAANAQEVAAPTADAAAVPDQAPELETTNSGNQITALDFVLGLGYNYRKFHSVKQYSRNVGGYYVGGGAGGAGGAGSQYGDCDPDPHQPEHEETQRIYIGNEEFGMSECFGYELNFLLPFYRRDGVRLAAALGYQFYDLDTKTTSAYGSSSFEFQMHSYDIGVKLTYELFDSFDLVATIGPSFNLIDMESSSFGTRDKSTRMKMGVFGAVGAQYWIRPWLGVCAELRYDKVFSDAVTRYAEMELDTWNTDLKLVFLF